MTDNSGIRVEGLNKLVRSLSKAGASAEDQKALMYDIGNIVIGAANVPVRTGKLKASLRAGRGKTKAVVRAGGAKANYAGPIHYGWPKRNIAPQPFLTNALDARQMAILRALEQGVDDMLKKNNLI